MRGSRALVGLAMATTLMVMACGGNNTTSGGSGGGPVAKKIALLLPESKTARYESKDRPLFEAKIKALCSACTIIYSNANEDSTQQQSQAEAALTNGANVLVLDAVDGAAAAAIADKAKAAKVPVISYDRLIKNSNVDLYVSHQVVKIGEMQAQYLLDHLPPSAPKPANFVIVGGSPTDNNALLLHQGQMNVLQPAVARGAVQIVKDDYAREWQASAALNIVENALTQANNNIQAVVASNDGTARGAVQALEGQNLAGKVLVSGQDADLASLQLIVQGKQTMTVYKPLQPLAYSAVDNALKLARGEAISAPDRVNNGRIDVPAILQTPIAVDINNIVSTIVKDGYQSLDKICQGAPPEKCPKQ